MSTFTPGPLAADASLHLLADHLLDALVAGELEPSLLHIGDVTEVGFDLGVLPLAEDHPSQLLIGLTAPPDWFAVGTAVGGWAFHLTDRLDRDRSRTRVMVVTLLSRTGELVHRLWSEDPALCEATAEEKPSGEQVDLLRRCLGLPTEPPPLPASSLWAAQWFAAILDAGPPPASWTAALALHPAMRLLDSATVVLDDDAHDVVAAFHRVCTWERLRSLSAAGRFAAPDLTASESGWMDEGAFARWVLSRTAPLPDLRDRLRSHVTASVFSEIAGFLERLEVPDCGWPHRSGPPHAA